MKCKDCKACFNGYFQPNDYVCIGVPEPFVIKDINAECTEYEDKRMKYENIEDCLVIGVDFDSRTNNGVVTVGRHQDGKLYIINVLENDEALDIYNKLIGVRDGQINKME